MEDLLDSYQREGAIEGFFTLNIRSVVVEGS